MGSRVRGWSLWEVESQIQEKRRGQHRPQRAQEFIQPVVCAFWTWTFNHVPRGIL